MYAHTYVVKVLTEHPIPEGWELDDVLRESVDGAYVAHVVSETSETLTREAMADALRAAGSTPDFFRLDDPCERCGSPVVSDRCTDATCPYSDRPQGASYTEG